MKATSLLLWGGIYLAQLHPGIAGEIAVPNFSFETPISGSPAPDGTIGGWQFHTVSVGSGSAIHLFNGGTEGSQYLRVIVSTSSLGSSILVTATSISNLATIDPGTTYTLTVAMDASGPGMLGTIDLLAGDSNAASASFCCGTNGRPLTDLVTSFTTSPSGDPLVGQPLKIQLAGFCNLPVGGGGVSFDNVRLSAEPGPRLTIVPLPDAQTQISWPTNFSGYTLTASTDLSSTNWPAVTNEVAIQGGQYVVVIQPAAQQNYYRIRKP